MALPGNLSVRTVVGAYVDLTGAPVVGQLTFSMSSVLTDISASVVIMPKSMTAVLDSSGRFSITLPVSDDTDVDPNGWQYKVTEQFDGLSGRTFFMSLPAGAAPLDISAVGSGSTTPPPAGAPAYALAVDLAGEIGARTAADSALSSRVGILEAGGGSGTAAPVTGIRRGGIPDLALTDTLYSGTAPTITTAQTTTSSITSAVKYAPPLVTLAGSDVRGDYLFLGGSDIQIGASAPDTSYALPTSKYPHTYASGQSAWAVEFVTDADTFEMRFKYIAATSMYRLSIDGKPLTAAPQSLNGLTAGSGHMLKVAFGSSAFRRIRFDFFTVPFGGIYIGPTFSLYRPLTTRGRMMVLGDSITDGSGQNSGQGVGTWLYTAARMMGVTDVWDQARGGTGYITPGSFATFGNRFAGDITPYAPELFIIKGGYNDSQGVQASIASAAASLFSAAKLALPSTKIIVVGPFNPAATAAGSLINTDNTIQAAATAANIPFVSLITGNTLNGAGTVVSTQSPFSTTVNLATAIGADGIHPTNAGHAALAKWMVRALTPLLPL